MSIATVVVQDQTIQGQDNRFFAATFSGGGMRAAALSFGALRAAQNTRLSDDNVSSTPDTLIEAFDFVSAVSGGSITAAYWALFGSEGYHRLSELFLEQDVQGQLIASALYPPSLVSLPTPLYSKTELLSDYLENSLFDQITYGDLLELKDRPYLVINATDMGTRSLFPFIQLQLDLICSDLRRIKLAEAVAASAAYPVVFPALTFQNHRAQVSELKGLDGSSIDASCLRTTIKQDLDTRRDMLLDSIEKYRKGAQVSQGRRQGIV